MRTLRTTKIADEFFRVLSKEKFTVTEKKSGSGYYIWNFGKDSVWHFKIKGAKRWKCGLWIRRKDEHGRKFGISVFAQHEDYIDKFKPTHSPISVEFEVNLEHTDWKDELWCDMFSFCLYMDRVRHSPVHAAYFYYAHRESYLSWRIGNLWFYRVVFPLREFRKDKLSKYVAKFFGFLIKCRFPKLKIRVVDTIFYSNKYELHVCYDYYYDKSEGISRIYHSRFMRAIENFVNKHACGWEMGHYNTVNDRRSFYFKDDK